MSTSDLTAGMPAPGHLRVSAPDDATRIEVLDGNLQPVPLEGMLGEVAVDVPAGVYAVRFLRGGAVTRRTVVVAPGAFVDVALDEESAPRFATAVPVRKTASTREFHRGPAQVVSRMPPLPAWPGHAAASRLMVFVRDLVVERSGDPSQGMTLHDRDGVQLVDFTQVGMRDLGQAWAGVHLALDPGAYRLRVAGRRRGYVEQMVYTCPGWQTQVFAFAEPADDDGKLRRASLDQVSVLMARESQGFDFERDDLRWTEVALAALANRGNVPGRVRTEMLWAKFDNPMLGILGGLLHLRRQTIDPYLMRDVVHNLLGLVGPLPDVLALACAAIERSPELAADAAFVANLEGHALDLPPMLRESWSALVRASARYPEIVQAGSLSDSVAARLLPSGPWLVWRGESDQAPIQAAVKGFAPLGFTRSLGMGDPDPQAVERLESLLPQLRDRLRVAALTDFPFAALDDAERRLSRAVYPLIDRRMRDLVGGSESLRRVLGAEDVDIGQDVPRLLSSLNMPAGVAGRIARRLIRKIG